MFPFFISGKKMALLRKFFCFELLTTGLIVGWLGIVESFTSVVSGFIMVENVDAYINPKYFPDTNPELVRRSEYPRMTHSFEETNRFSLQW